MRQVENGILRLLNISNTCQVIETVAPFLTDGATVSIYMKENHEVGRDERTSAR